MPLCPFPFRVLYGSHFVNYLDWRLRRAGCSSYVEQLTTMIAIKNRVCDDIRTCMTIRNCVCVVYRICLPNTLQRGTPQAGATMPPASMQCVRVTPRLRDIDLLSQQLLRGGPMPFTDVVSCWNFRMVVFFLIWGPISEKTVGMQTEVVLHSVMKVQVYRACFHGREAGTNFGGKVEYWIRRKKEERIEHPQ